MLKKIGIMVLAASIMMSGAAYAETKETESEMDWTITWQEESKFLKESGMSDSELAKVKVLFDKAVALEKGDKFDRADKIWDQVYKMVDKYYDAGEEQMTWQEELPFLKEMGVNEAGLKTLEKLFNEAVKDPDKWSLYDKELEKLVPGIFDAETIDFGAEKDFLKEIGVSEADMAKVEALSKEIETLNKEKKYDEANKKWDQVEKILEKYYKAFEAKELAELDFKNEVEWLKEMGVPQTEITNLEKLFNEAVALLKADKHDEAEKKWSEYDKLLDKYFEAHDAKELASLNFADEKEFLKEMGVPETDFAKLEKLYNDALALLKAKKHDEAEKIWSEYDKLLSKYVETFEAKELANLNFSEEKDFLKEMGVPETELKTLEKLFNEAVALVKAKKHDEADKKWDEYHKVLEKYEASFENETDMGTITFAQEKEWLKELKVPETEMAKLEKLFNEAIKLENADKMEEADKVWDTYFEALDKYLK